MEPTDPNKVEEEEEEEEEHHHHQKLQEEEEESVADADAAAVAAASSNIPHMHLFMCLKRRFPGLKDADITDSIQRFGLDKNRCENELLRRSQEQHRGYYSPWNRSRASSRGSTSSRNSPLSPSDTHSHTSSPLQNGSSPSTPYAIQPSLILNHYYPEAHKDKSQRRLLDLTFDPCSFSPIGQRKFSSPQLSDSGIGRSANGFSNLIDHPSSAPIVVETREPFFDDIVSVSRKDGETVDERGLKTPENRYTRGPTPEEIANKLFNPVKNFCLSPSRSTTPTPTMSPPSNASSPSATNTNFSASPVNSQKSQNQQTVPAAIQEQLSRKEKLKEELSRRLDEQCKLESEIQHLTEQLETREKSQMSEVKKCKTEIEMIQLENNRLQCLCDQMERKILESGESPKTDQEGRLLDTRNPSSPSDLHSPNPHFEESSLRFYPQHPLPNVNTSSSLSSGGGTQRILSPSRRAPSPPVSSSSSPPRPRVFEQGTQRPATVVTDERRKEWSCSKCTFNNSPYLNECEMCGFPHFSVGTPNQLPSQNPHTTPSASTPNPGGPCYCHHRRHHNMNHEHRNAVRDI